MQAEARENSAVHDKRGDDIPIKFGSQQIFWACKPKVEMSPKCRKIEMFLLAQNACRRARAIQLSFSKVQTSGVSWMSTSPSLRQLLAMRPEHRFLELQ